MFRICLQKMNYDLDDCTLWEFMFPSDDKPKLLLPEDELDDFEDDEEVDFMSCPLF